MHNLAVLVLGAGLLVSAGRAQEQGESGADDPLARAPAPLATAIREYARGVGFWAFTQHSFQFDRRGRMTGEKVARHDPSRHYDEQWTLLSVDGKEATEAQIRKHRRQKKPKNDGDRKSLGELLDVQRAVVVEETPESLTYEVPLLLENNTRLPPEKFRVFVHLDGPDRTLRLVEVKLRESLRVAVVVNVKSGGARIEFSPVLPEYGPVATAIAAAGQGSILLVPVGGRSEMTRTDFERVTPYDDRFQVILGPLKTLDF